MTPARDPRAIDVAASCRAGAALNGATALAGLPRLSASLLAAGEGAGEVTWAVQPECRPVAGGEAELWLHLKAQAEVRLQCQRCLQAMRQALEVDRRYRFVAGEKEAERLDEEIEDDVLALPVRLDLIELIEDELILALPIVPRHEGACPDPLPMPKGEDAAAAPPNPFAKLAALRGKGSGDDPGPG